VRAVFHASGREDVDALMLGEGRPFIVEIIHPKRRRLDLRKLEVEINRRAGGLIEVKDLSLVPPNSVRRMKQAEAKAPKVYRVVVRSEDKPLTEEDVKKAEVELSNKIIHQWTPKRVLHRRANKLRRRRVYSCKGTLLSSRRMLLWIKCEGGLYIRELISGDDGRTLPSLSSLLSKKVICELLDVAGVE
ncbi:MAG: tRNA pseudouridine(54/55) synthase Pus10, partial [Thermoproteota archaeon]